MLVYELLRSHPITHSVVKLPSPLKTSFGIEVIKLFSKLLRKLNECHAKLDANIHTKFQKNLSCRVVH